MKDIRWRNDNEMISDRIDVFHRQKSRKCNSHCNMRKVMKKREAELEFSKHKVQRDYAKSPWVLNKRCTLTMAAWQTNSNEMPATISQNVKNFLENLVPRDDRSCMRQRVKNCNLPSWIFERYLHRFENVEMRIFNQDFKE